jgi:thymidylate kinase
MNKGFSICFFGIDGSGKSTLAKSLYLELKKRQYDVNYVWWLKGDQSLVRRTLKAVGSSRYTKLEMDAKQQKVVTSDGRIANRVFTSLFPKILVADYLRFGLINAWLPILVASDKVLIFDRFMWDVILAISREFEFTPARRLKFFRLCRALLPKPDLVFTIDVPPEVCYLRKKQEIESQQESYDKWEIYQALRPLLDQLTEGKIMHVDNTRNPQDVQEEILTTTLEQLEGGGHYGKSGNYRD